MGDDGDPWGGGEGGAHRGFIGEGIGQATTFADEPDSIGAEGPRFYHEVSGSPFTGVSVSVTESSAVGTSGTEMGTRTPWQSASERRSHNAMRRRLRAITSSVAYGA